MTPQINNDDVPNRTHHIPYLANFFRGHIEEENLEELSKLLMALFGACTIVIRSGQRGVCRHSPTSLEDLRAVIEIGGDLFNRLVYIELRDTLFISHSSILDNTFERMGSLTHYTQVIDELLESLIRRRIALTLDHTNVIIDAIDAIVARLYKLGVDEGRTAPRANNVGLSRAGRLDQFLQSHLEHTDGEARGICPDVLVAYDSTSEVVH